jgi:hypothetical protein
VRSEVEVVAKKDDLFNKVWHYRYTEDGLTGRTKDYPPEILEQAGATAADVEALYNDKPGRGGHTPLYTAWDEVGGILTQFAAGVLYGRLCMAFWVLGDKNEFNGDT